MENLGGRLKRARQKSGLALREVARQLGVSASFVSQMENGKSTPSVATLYSMAQLLDVSIDELFSGEQVDALGDHNPTAPDASAHDTSADSAPTRDASTRDASARDASARDGSAHGVSGHGVSGHGVSGHGASVAAPGAMDPGGVEPISRSALGSPADAWPHDQVRPRISVTRPGERKRLEMDTGVVWEQLAGNTGAELDFMFIFYPPHSTSTNDKRMLQHAGSEFGYLLEGALEVTVGFEVVELRAGDAIGFDSSTPHLLTNKSDRPARGIWFVRHPHA